MSTSTLAYLKNFHQKPFPESYSAQPELETRLKSLLKNRFNRLVDSLLKTAPESRVEEDMFYTVFGETEKDGWVYETVLCIDLLNDKIFVGQYAGDTQSLRTWEEDPKLIPPPFRMWKEDEH